MSIDPKTRLIKDDLTEDSWRGIKVFVAVVDKYGLEGLTVVGFTADYLTPFRHYPKKADRFIRAQDEVYGDRMKLSIDDEIIKAGIDKWNDLQYNNDLEQERVMEDIKTNMVEQLSKANNESDFTKVSQLTRDLQKHQGTIRDFKSGFDRDAAVGLAVTQNDYTLTRIENDIASRKNSKFVNHDNALENPDKLKLNANS